MINWTIEKRKTPEGWTARVVEACPDDGSDSFKTHWDDSLTSDGYAPMYAFGQLISLAVEQYFLHQNEHAKDVLDQVGGVMGKFCDWENEEKWDGYGIGPLQTSLHPDDRTLGEEAA